MEALKLLKKNRTTEERAEKYTERIKSSLTIKILTNLEEKIEKIADNIYDLENFNLSTDLNKGEIQLTKEECEDRFIKIIELNYAKKLLELELKAKKEIFTHYFE